MITDHSSAGFEFLLRDRPLVRIHRPQLIELANIHPTTSSLLASVSRSVDGLAGDPGRRRARPGRSRPSSSRARAGSPPSSSTGRAAPPRARWTSCTRLMELDRRAGRAAALRGHGRGAMATVSVVMPAFNVAPYIGAAIESVDRADRHRLGAGRSSTTARPTTTAGRSRRLRDVRRAHPAVASRRTAACRRRATRALAHATGELHRHPRQRRPLAAAVPGRAARHLRSAARRRHRHRQRLVPRRPARTAAPSRP